MAIQFFKQKSDYLHSGSPDDSRLFHTDSSDQIQVWLPHVGQGYMQTIPLQEGLSLVILDYTVHNTFLSHYPRRSQFLEFEFCITGPSSGHSTFYRPIDLTSLLAVCKPQQQRQIKVEVCFGPPFFMPYLHKVFEHLASQEQKLIYTWADQVYRSQLGYGATSPQVAFKHMMNGTVSLSQLFRADQTFGQLGFLSIGNLRRSMTPAMHQVVNQILSCPYSGRVRRSYLERKALELVSLKLKILDPSRVLAYPLNSDDLDGIYQAAKILACTLNNPPSVEALARQVGLNRLKLNHGFHQVYGTTPYRYLRTCRLELANHLLSTSELAIEEVAYRVGYTSRTSFTGAFCHRFGLSPKTFQLQILRRLQRQHSAS
ncbi:MAG: AraC family transcriptional regulator [Cyanobacteria bacterium P01_H01_bin.21]